MTCDSDGSGEADKTGTGLAEGDSAGRKASPETQGHYPDGSLVAKALQSARSIIQDIDDYQSMPGRGDYGVECACCMGELLDDDREAIALIDQALASLSTPASYSQRREDDPAPAVAPEDDGLAAEWAKIVESARFNGGYHYFVTPAFAEQTLAALRRPSQQTEPVDGWIVGNGDGTLWRTWKSGIPEWSANREEATRYARRVDAEAVHGEDEDAWRVVPFPSQQTEPVCTVPPEGWYCTRKPGHEGPCAAKPTKGKLEDWFGDAPDAEPVSPEAGEDRVEARQIVESYDIANAGGFEETLVLQGIKRGRELATLSAPEATRRITPSLVAALIKEHGDFSVFSECSPEQFEQHSGRAEPGWFYIDGFVPLDRVVKALTSAGESVTDAKLLREALEPFARIAADIMRLRGKDPIADDAVLASVFGITLTWGPFKRARAALSPTNKVTEGERDK